MQRRAGCSFLFCKTAKSVLRAAKGLQQSKPPTPNSFDFVKPTEESKEESEKCTSEGLDLCTALLSGSSRRDAHLLGLESLAQMSQCTKNRAFCAEAILRGGNLSMLISLVESYRVEISANLSSMEREHLVMMHRLSLIVLANCIQALAEEESRDLLGSCVRDHPQLVELSLLTCLVEQIANAVQQPFEACAAIKCLHGLIAVSENVKQQVLMIGAPKAVQLAQKQGAASCLLLEQESCKLQDLLSA
jgi:hypothetical protein